MKKNRRKVNNILKSKSGMTLTELLVAMTLLVIVSLCFLPLFQTYYGNITTVGQVTKSNYVSEGIIEKLIGMVNRDWQVNAYSTDHQNIPLKMTVEKTDTAIAANSYGLNNITGKNISSVPERIDLGYSTFIGDSTTTKMVCYPQHISDDFLTKDITIYAAGFTFSDESEFSFCYTDSNGNPQPINQGSNNGRYYSIKINSENAHVAILTLKGDNGVICFENSPLIINYTGHESLSVEIDAPTVIMVGEKGSDGYYYYVTSGEIKDDGSIDIIRKQMNSIDTVHSGVGTVTLNSAMNDVAWVAAGDGDDGAGGTNQYGYYVMCGDNGQIRRFWRNPNNGNYYWSGDYTTPYYVNSINATTSDYEEPARVVSAKTFSTTVDTSYAYSVDPRVKYGQNLISAPFYKTNSILHPDFNSIGAYNRLMTQNVYSVNALSGHSIYTLGTLMYITQQKVSGESNAGDEINKTKDRFLNTNYNNLVNAISRGEGFTGDNGKWVATDSHTTKLPNYASQIVDNSYYIANNVVKRDLSSMQSYYSYNGITDNSATSSTTLTSVGSIKMRNTYSSTKYPTSSYTLYCGYVPAVMDIWTDNNEGNNVSYRTGTDNTVFTTWRATLGLAYNNNADKSYYMNENVFKGYVSSSSKYKLWLTGHAYTYGNIPDSEFAVSGVCSPLNYKYYDNNGDLQYYRTLKNTLDDQASDSTYNLNEYPLNVSTYQNELMNQNETVVSIAYLSNPYAFADVPVQRNYYDLSSSRYTTPGVVEWCFDDSRTIMDMDGINYETYDAATETFKENNFSIAVGYVVAGLLFEPQSGSYEKYVSTPTVMNNGIVYLRAGGANNVYELDTSSKSNYQNDRTASAMLSEESNIFHQFYYTDVYNQTRNIETTGVKNTLMKACSANYWRDAFHPVFYSTYGDLYNVSDKSDKYSYIMSHALQDKRLNCTAWGWTWQNAPEAMWGASDGTLMSWALDVNAAQSSDSAQTMKVTSKSTNVEFQSYQQLEYNNLHYLQYNTTTFEHQYCAVFGIGTGSNFNVPLNWSDMNYNAGVDGDLENTYTGANGSPSFDITKDAGRGLCGIAGYYSDEDKNGWFLQSNNSYWDRCSVELDNMTFINQVRNGQTDSSFAYSRAAPTGKYITNDNSGYGMMSPLKSIEDVAYSNDIWVACGVQGLANPKSGTVSYGGKTTTVKYCQDKAVVSTSTTGSWVCVRHWIDVADNGDKGPCENNAFYQWQVVQISKTPNCNIQQVTCANGLWYAVGYIDANKDGTQDADEHAVVFYASDPTKACGQENGWTMSDPGNAGYTRCWKNNSGEYTLMDIEGVNAVASRND